MQKRGRVSAHLRPPHTDTLLYRHKHTEKAFSPTKDVVLSRTFFSSPQNPSNKTLLITIICEGVSSPTRQPVTRFCFCSSSCGTRGNLLPTGTPVSTKRRLIFPLFLLLYDGKLARFLFFLLSNPAGSSGVVDHFFLFHK